MHEPIVPPVLLLVCRSYAQIIVPFVVSLFFRLLLFNSSSLASFSNVDIGRDKEMNVFHSSYNVKSLTLNPNFTNFMQNTEGCANFENYEIEDEAVKFGDKPNCYVVVRKNFWKNDFLLELDFRTFYPNGLILFSVIVRILRETHLKSYVSYVYRVVTNSKVT